MSWSCAGRANAKRSSECRVRLTRRRLSSGSLEGSVVRDVDADVGVGVGVGVGVDADPPRRFVPATDGGVLGASPSLPGRPAEADNRSVSLRLAGVRRGHGISCVGSEGDPRARSRGFWSGVGVGVFEASAPAVRLSLYSGVLSRWRAGLVSSVVGALPVKMDFGGRFIEQAASAPMCLYQGHADMGTVDPAEALAADTIQ